MSTTTLPRAQVLRILAACVDDEGQYETIRAMADDPARTEGPPIDGGPITHLVALALGDRSRWAALCELRPDLTDLDRDDIPAVVARLLDEREVPRG